MSRIFDALRRAGAEQTGVEYADTMSVATKVFEAQRPSAGKSSDTPAAVPGFALDAAESASSSVDQIRSQFPRIEVVLPPGSRLVFASQPDGLAVEKFRFLAVRLREMRQTRPLQKVLITSTIPEEGKSLVSANLAGVTARKQQKVLLIEGDLRRPVLAEGFGIRKLPGLAEWLKQGAEKASNIYRLDGAGFWFMPAGEPPADTTELMQSGRLAHLMQQLSALFDWIIVDSPPLLPLADTTLWSRFTDGTLLVAREGKTEKTQLERGLETLKKADLLGVVLNGCTHPDQKNYYQRYMPHSK
jgi:capsular exopolysaccharide synthesis family protein